MLVKKEREKKRRTKTGDASAELPNDMSDVVWARYGPRRHTKPSIAL
jgi:hypothetical protein